MGWALGLSHPAELSTKGLVPKKGSPKQEVPQGRGELGLLLPPQDKGKGEDVTFLSAYTPPPGAGPGPSPSWTVL